MAGSLKHLGKATIALREDDALRARLRATVRAHVLCRFDLLKVAGKALRIAELSLEHDDRHALIKRLRREPDLQTDTTDEEAKALLQNTLGSPNSLELLRMRLVHHPLIQRGIAAYLGWRRRTAAVQGPRKSVRK